MLTQEQIEARRQGIGGSDAGAIAGLNPWKSPVDVYLEKVGDVQQAEQNEAMYWGTLLEDTIARAYAEKTGHKIQRRTKTLRHPEMPWMIAHLDRVILGDKRGPGVLEIKTAGRPDGWGEPGTDEIPDCYMAQVAHYMAVTGYAWARLAVLIGGRDFRVYDIPRDEDLIQALVEIERRFWQEHVEPRVPPDPRSLQDLNALWPQDSGRVVQATPEIVEAVSELDRIKSEIADLEEIKKRHEATIKAYMEDAAVLEDEAGNVLATWKTSQTSRIDTKALRACYPEIADEITTKSTIRRFLPKKPKPQKEEE